MLYEVANYGKCPAVIDDVLIEFALIRGEPERPSKHYEFSMRRIIKPDERPHDFHHLDFQMPANLSLDDVEYGKSPVPQISERRELFFWVIIKYRSPFERGYETSACFKWDAAMNSFSQKGLEKYNYAK